MISRRIGQLSLRAFIVAALVFLLGPLIVVAGVSLNGADLIQFPPRHLSLHWFADAMQMEGFLDSLQLSLELAVLTTVLAAILGMAAALALTRYRFRGRGVLVGFFLSPLVLPEIVVGIALLQYFRSIGTLSTFTTLVLGHVAVTMPYMIRTLMANLQVVNESLFEAARMLGADAVQTFIHVTLPGVRTGFMAGCLFAFIISFDNYSVSLFLSDPQTETLPIRMLEYSEIGITPTLAAAATLLIGFSTVLLVVAARIIGLRRLGGLSERG